MLYFCAIFTFLALVPSVARPAERIGSTDFSFTGSNENIMPEESGFHILETGDESLTARLALINSAQKTLDLQYYAINDDLTSNLLIEALIRAADRGVKIRFLIDDISIEKPRKNLLILNAVDLIEVRVFNPITTINQTFPARMIAFFTDLPRTTQRMHNKALIMDGRVAIIGGRNLGDEYFDAHSDTAFKDVDVLSDGSVTQKIHHNFEKFWNDRENTYPITDLHSDKISPDDIKKLREKLAEGRKKDEKDSKGKTDLEIRYDDYIKKEALITAPADFIGDTPEKLDDNDKPPEIMRVYSLINEAKKDILIVSPYFVPGDEGVGWLQDLKNRGVNVRIVTNSLASTDVVAVHTGYGKYRKEIIESGAELYELKPISGKKPKQRVLGRKAPSYASLHAKVYVIDEKIAIIGSLNFDPRSAYLNTEVAMVIYNEQIAKELLKVYRDISAPEFSYKVGLDEGDIVWTAKNKDHDLLFRHEPQASIWRRMQASLISLLPVEDQL
jgi:cardiolipin synthase C